MDLCMKNLIKLPATQLGLLEYRIKLGVAFEN